MKDELPNQPRDSSSAGQTTPVPPAGDSRFEPLVIDDHDRYGRLRLISWWRQERLHAARVLVVGAGALGNEVIKNLALLGLGTTYLIDLDVVEPSNLSRSVLFRERRRRPAQGRGRRARARELNPEITIIPLHGDVITDLGLGLFADVDLVIGCLDNREARLWVNRQCWKTGTPWIDAGIQEIQGVVKVFVPPDSACYECAMTERDYQLLNLRYSCPLLSREEISAGKVPTAPTIASMMAALQVQEALKLLHGMPVAAGTAWSSTASANQFYSTRLPFRDDCLSHETYPEPVELRALDRDNTVARAFAAAAGRRSRARSSWCWTASWSSRSTARAATGVARSCGRGVRSRRPRRSARSAASRHGPSSSAPSSEDSPLVAQPLSRVGIPPYDIVRVDGPAESGFFLLAADRASSATRVGNEPLSGDEIIFGEMQVREPERRHRPDRDRQFACLAYEVPAPADLPIFLDHRAADAIERHALWRHVRRAGRHPAGQGMPRPGHRPAVRLDHPVARGQALRQHPGELHLHPRLLGGDHPPARPAVPRLRHRRLVSHASQLRDLPVAPRPVHPPAFLRPAAPGGLRGRPDQPDARLLPVA